MQFNSYSYLLLLLPIVVVFWIFPSSWRRWYVLSVSLLFYATWNPLFVFVPIGICSSTYLFARMTQVDTRRARAWMWIGITLVLAALSFFKYRSFVVGNLSAWLAALGIFHRVWVVAIMFPLGISFYSFEAISYLVDVRQKRLSKLDFLDLCLFICFWPHLIAGPIVRARELIPQLKFDVEFEPDFVIRGLDRIIWGLVQKNLIANSIAGWIDTGFMPNMALLDTTIDNWFLAVAFGLQIYFDFAAYSNMAIGTAQLLGIRLPENFRFPYHALTPPDFWARWHMTLSRWVRDYLFFPINARYTASPLALYLSLLGIMALVGLWHGAGWGFMLWGLMQGAYLVLYRIWESLKITRFAPMVESRPAAWIWRFLTLIGVAAAWIPFRAGSLHQAAIMLRSMFLRFSFGVSLPVNFYLVTLMVVAFVALEPYFARCSHWLNERIAEQWANAGINFLLLRPVAYACGLLLFMLFDDRDTQFIYFQF
jgi:alginate O-acetyltransferase complex protein AlgI